MKVIAFDLEGPLTPQDNAYDLMQLLPGGGKIFEAISRYDDLLTLEGKPGYEPGDTLALIVPFLLRHGLRESSICDLAQTATLVSGAEKLVHDLMAGGWQVFCITTTYRQYSEHVTGKLGIPAANLAGTYFPLDSFLSVLGERDFAPVTAVEKSIVALSLPDDSRLKGLLDRFYWHDLPGTKLGDLVAEIKPMGGRRKAEALARFAERAGYPLGEWVVVGDSITDFRMFEVVNKAGGLAVAFNANEYALPYATLGLASTNISDLMPVLESWATGKRMQAARAVSAIEPGQYGDRRIFHWLAGTHQAASALRVHRKIRSIVRQAAARLG